MPSSAAAGPVLASSSKPIVEPMVLGVEGQRVHAQVRERIVCTVAGTPELRSWVTVASLRDRAWSDEIGSVESPKSSC